MARVRSPAHPGHALPEAIEYARKVHGQDRQHPVARSVAAQHMGFSGLTGTSDRAISSLLHYGLAEKGGKGEIRISDLTLRILHPENEQERLGALNEAGFGPQLFRELRKRYPGRPPAAANLESFLTREGFASVAIGPATKAYLETCRFLEQEGAYESDMERPASGTESAPSPSATEERPVQHIRIPTPEASTTHTQVPEGLRSDIYTLSGGGQVILSLPEALSQRDYDDLKDWLDLMGRKAKRSISTAAAAAAAAPEAAEAPEEIDKDQGL